MEEVSISDTKQECEEAKEESDIKNVVKCDMFPVVCFRPPRMTIANSNSSITENIDTRCGPSSYRRSEVRYRGTIVVSPLVQFWAGI